MVLVIPELPVIPATVTPVRFQRSTALGPIKKYRTIEKRQTAVPDVVFLGLINRARRIAPTIIIASTMANKDTIKYRCEHL